MYPVGQKLILRLVEAQFFLFSSYNLTPNSRTKLSPQDANNSLLDPVLRSRSDRPYLVPFDEFLTKTLRLQKQAQQPSKVPNTDSDWRRWHVNDLVILDFPKTYLSRGQVKLYWRKLHF